MDSRSSLNAFAHQRVRHQHGASMVELMVAVMVGLLVALSALGAAQTFGSVGRSQDGQAGAVGSAMASLSALRYDLQMAGLGFFSDASPQCATFNLYTAAATLASGSVFQAVRIDRLPDGTDRIDVLYATDVTGGAGSRTISPMTRAMGPTLVDAGSGLSSGQTVLLSAPLTGMPCTVATVGAASVQAGGRIELRFDTPGTHTPADWAATFPALAAYPDSSSVARLGQLVWRRYAVSGNALLMTDMLTGTTVTIAEGVAVMRAQYGLATDTASAAIAQWQDATGTAALSAAEIPRLRALRLGVLSVSAQRERPQSASCDASSAVPELWSGETPDLSSRPDWQCFRYRAYSAVIGLRNLQWGQRL